MSSSVQEQMKAPGNTAAKNTDDRSIPWSQQVDEASYENLASPTADDNSANNQNSTQFQYPPFYAKEPQNASFNNYKSSRKPSNNYDKKYGKPAFYNTKRDDFQPNAWSANNTKRIIGDNSSGNYNRSNRLDDGGYLSDRLNNRQNNDNAGHDEKKQNVAPPISAPKKTTWASIASQPAKLTSRAVLTTSTLKKKGPGMPPPPMVPGKHNLDVTTWDVPNNNLPPVPSPPPPPIEQQSNLPEINFESSGHSHYGSGGNEGNNVHNNYNRMDRPSRDYDSQRDDGNKPNMMNNSSNYGGRMRGSPNGHSNKKWSTQHPLHPNPNINQNQQHSHRSIGGGGGPTGAGGGGGGGPPTSVGPGSIRRGVDNNSMAQTRFMDRRGGGGGSSAYFGGSGRHHHDQDSNTNMHESRDDAARARSEHNCSVEEVGAGATEAPQAVLEELRDKNNYNPMMIDLEKASTARFFVIKSYSEDDIHRSIKYEIWCSTDHGNKRLDDAFKERHEEGGNILLFFSVNGSGHFCGMAQMMTAVDYNSTSSVWSQDKWKGKFKVKWIYVKDVPNSKLRHIRLENNENKAVTNSRDTQEVPNPKGIEVLQILHAYKHITSIFDDFYHYEKKQEEEVSSKKPSHMQHDNINMSHTHSPVGRHYGRHDDREKDRNDRDRDRDGGRSMGGQQQNKYFNTGSHFRERNNSYRSGGGSGFQTNFNDHRRFNENLRAGSSGGSDYQYNRDDTDRENSEYGGGGAGGRKYEHSNRSQQVKHNRDFSDDQKRSDSRYRSGPRELQKDNEFPITDRVRGIEYN